jgi:HlyD family secretion protein
VSDPERIQARPERAASPSSGHAAVRGIIVGVLSAAIIGLAIWYLARPEPLLVQGEVDSTRVDIAARVSGRLAKLAVARGQDVPAGAALVVIDNPELVAQLHEAEAEKALPMPNWRGSTSALAPRSSPSARPKSNAPRPT